MDGDESESPEEQPVGEVSPEQREAHRDRLLDTVERMELEYDKALLVLQPSGITVTSALLVGLLNAHAVISDYSCLYLAWTTWIIGITSTLASFQISAAIHRLAANDWALNKEPHDNETIKYLGVWLKTTNLASGGAFVLGIIFASLFLYRLQK
jgi:hypothetical protein